MTDIIKIRFGPATVELSAEEPYTKISAILGNWLGCSSADQSARPDVHLKISGHPDRQHLSEERAWTSSEGGGWWDGKAWDAIPGVNATTGQPEWRLHLHESPTIKATRFMPGFLTRWAHIHWFNRHEILANAALYGQLLPAAQEALRHHDATLVHASAVAGPDGEAILLLGRGGAGKTSASTQLYIRKPDKWKYMSDDLAILAADGTLYRSPIPLNVFPYNTERFSELWTLLADSMTPFEALQWRIRHALLGASGVARRRAPFSENLGPDTAHVSQVVELYRASISEPVSDIADAESMAREARDVLAHELRRGFEGMAQLRKTNTNNPESNPDPGKILDSAESVMRRVFSSASVHRIGFPKLAPPDEVCRTVERVTVSGS